MNSVIKKISLVALIAAISIGAIQAQDAPKWKIDKAHTSVNFSINHFFSPVTGSFSDYSGHFNLDPNNLAGSHIDFTVAINSVNTADKKRDKHLQSADFFDENSYPTMTFQSANIEKVSDSEYLLNGKLTIKKTTHNVSLPMTITGEMEHPMMKGTLILGLLIDTTINRNDYGVGTGDWAATMVVGDEVHIYIPMELNRKK